MQRPGIACSSSSCGGASRRGTVAEILAKELKRDIGTRLHRFRSDLTAELNWCHPRGEAIVNAFVGGEHRTSMKR
jgi:hypothetical protein